LISSPESLDAPLVADASSSQAMMDLTERFLFFCDVLTLSWRLEGEMRWLMLDEKLPDKAFNGLFRFIMLS
jgi:hypothetical protein